MNDNNHEVEIRAILAPNQTKSVFKQLNKLGAKKIKEVNLADYYWCPNKVTTFKEIEMNEVGSYSLRTRKSPGKSELNVKIITNAGDHNAWEEHEVEINSLSEASAILVAMGYKIFFSLEKKRQIFTLNKFSINIEEIKDFGPVIEIEIITNKKNSSKAKQIILSLLNDMGIEKDQIVEKSITNIIMRKNSKF